MTRFSPKMPIFREFSHETEGLNSLLKGVIKDFIP